MPLPIDFRLVKPLRRPLSRHTLPVSALSASSCPRNFLLNKEGRISNPKVLFLRLVNKLSSLNFFFSLSLLFSLTYPILPYLPHPPWARVYAKHAVERCVRVPANRLQCEHERTGSFGLPCLHAFLPSFLHSFLPACLPARTSVGLFWIRRTPYAIFHPSRCAHHPVSVALHVPVSHFAYCPLDWNENATKHGRLRCSIERSEAYRKPIGRSTCRAS
jgi:hypothetical protein